MSKVIDYYLSVQSPWTYLGHQRLISMADRYEAIVAVKPISAAIVFPATGGLALAQRAPARQAYRKVELERWRHCLNVPLNLDPAYFPADERLAMGMVTALRDTSNDLAIGLVGRLLRAVWAEERNIADRTTLCEIASSLDLDAEPLLAKAEHQDEVIAQDSHLAIERGVFGMPTYVYENTLYWGQDRLAFLEQALSKPS